MNKMPDEKQKKIIRIATIVGIILFLSGVAVNIIVSTSH